MRYQGSKNRHAKAIIPHFRDRLLSAPAYVEPFVGGFNMIQHVSAKRRIANDINPYLIALFQALLDGWEPPDHLSKNEYENIRNNKTQYPRHLVGFVGFACSYAGKFFNGYAQGGTNKDGTARNHCGESKRAVLKQVSKLQGVELSCLPYDCLDFPIGSVVYCDPPYVGTTRYAIDFDHDVFWDWVRLQSQAGSFVFVSEYEAPKDFTELWEKNVHISHDKGGTRAVERLFCFDP